MKKKYETRLLQKIKTTLRKLSFDIIQNVILPFYQFDANEEKNLLIKNLYMKDGPFVYPIFTNFRFDTSFMGPLYHEEKRLKELLDLNSKFIIHLETNKFNQRFIYLTKLKYLTITDIYGTIDIYKKIKNFTQIPNLEVIKFEGMITPKFFIETGGFSFDIEPILPLNFPKLKKIVIINCSFLIDSILTLLENIPNQDIVIKVYININDKEKVIRKEKIGIFINIIKDYFVGFKEIKLLEFGPYENEWIPPVKRGLLPKYGDIRDYYIENKKLNEKEKYNVIG
jgi:hypothetical protein